jgi:hypothetical protein
MSIKEQNQVETTVGKQPKRIKHTHKRLRKVEPKWIRKAMLTILYRKINSLLITEPSKYTKDDSEWILKASSFACKLDKEAPEPLETYEVDLPDGV